MTIIKSSPTSPGKRWEVRVVHSHIHKGKPYSRLLGHIKNTGGRNNQGRITVRHIGGRSRRKYRILDFKRNKDGIKAKIQRIEYDPNRSALIALIVYSDGEKRYILLPENVKVNDIVLNGEQSPIKDGNCLPLCNIPIGTVIHCVEIKPGKGAQLLRSAGCSGQIIARENKYSILKLRSGETRKVLSTCRAVIGTVSNYENNLRVLGKAGANRRRGIRPTVRGVAMNPVDHPHGGGEGKTSGGRHPVNPNGIPTKGYKTRNNKRTNFYIIKNRKK